MAHHQFLSDLHLATAFAIVKFCVAFWPELAVAQSFAIPNAYETVEGNSSSSYPFWDFGTNTVRYQQIYAASEFSNATNGGWIYQLNFRDDSERPYDTYVGFNATLTNVEIRLSTTSRTPDGLSPVFSENVGIDQTLVFSNFLAMSSAWQAFQQPQPWDIEVQLSTAFWYNPAAGNLLMDLQIREGTDVRDFIPPFDAVDMSGDSVSRVYATSVDATSGTTDTVGLVTLITLAPIPSLRAYTSNFGTSTNYIAIRWPTHPTIFVLQSSTSLGPNAFWQTLPNVGGSNQVFQEYHIPVSSAGSNAFYRLVWRSG
jgi:hypothetical protein